MQTPCTYPLCLLLTDIVKQVFQKFDSLTGDTHQATKEVQGAPLAAHHHRVVSR